MNLKKKEAEAQKLLQGQQDASMFESEPMLVSPGDTKAIVINGRSPPRSQQEPPASMPAFLDRNEFGHVKKLSRKTSLKVSSHAFRNREEY